MNARQNAKNSMYHAALLILLSNGLIYATLVALVAAVTKLTDFLDELDALIVQQDKIRTGYAQDKKNKRIAMVELAIKVKGAVQAMAEDTNNPVLFDSVAFDESTLLTQRASASKAQCQIIHLEGFAVLAQLADYGVVAADLTALKNAITAFADVMSMPKAVKAELKSATADIVVKMKAIDDLLKKKIDKQMLIYKANPATSTFWKDYTNARRIDDPATHFTEIRATILNQDTNEPMSNVTMIGENSTETFEEISNENGIADKKQIHPEVTDLTFEIPGFETVKKTLDVHKGKKELITIKMKPLV